MFQGGKNCNSDREHGERKKERGGLEQTDRIQAVLSAPVLHIIQDRKMQVDSSAPFIFSSMIS